MAACAHLVPVFEREGGEGRGVGKLQVGEVPIQDLAIPGRQVDVAVETRRRERETNGDQTNNTKFTLIKVENN